MPEISLSFAQKARIASMLEQRKYFSSSSERRTQTPLTGGQAEPITEIIGDFVKLFICTMECILFSIINIPEIVLVLIAIRFVNILEFRTILMRRTQKRFTLEFDLLMIISGKKEYS